MNRFFRYTTTTGRPWMRDSTLRRPLIAAAIALLGAGAAGCGDLVLDSRQAEILATGAVGGTVRLDQDGNGILGGGDPPVPGLRIQLLSAVGGAVIDTATTSSEGSYLMPAAPVGEYRIGVDPATLPDNLYPFGIAPDPILLSADRNVQVNFGLTMQEYTPAEVRGLPTERWVFTRGIVLNVRNQPGDAVVHIREGNTYLRVTEVDPVNLTVGDSVRVRGRTTRAATQPILAGATIFRLVQQAALVTPVDISTAEATLASGETLDAGLVRIRNAAIVDTASVGGNLRVTVNDGSGAVDLFLREFLTFNRTQLVPGGAVVREATGLLVPVQTSQGLVRWRVNPRAQADLIVDPIPGP